MPTWDMAAGETLPGEPQAFAFIFPVVFLSGKGGSGCKYRNMGQAGRGKAQEGVAALGVREGTSERRKR